MAYGYARGRRDYEPDPRDIIEDAARAAGMSVPEWLELQSARHGYSDDAPRMPRRRNRSTRDELDESPLDGVSRRFGRRTSLRDERISEERVARILDDAMDAMQDTIRGNEEKTASVIAALGEQMEAQARAQSLAVQHQNAVQKLVTDIEAGLSPQSLPVTDGTAGRSTIDLLEQRISNVVSMLEKKSPAPVADLRRNKSFRADSGQNALLQTEVAALGDRLSHLSRNLTQQSSIGMPQAAKPDLSQHLGKLTQEIARLSRIAQPASSSPDVMGALAQINTKIDQLEQSAMGGAQPIDRVAREVAALRAGLGAMRETPVADMSVIDRRFETLAHQLNHVVERIGQIDRTPSAAPSLDRFAEEIASLRAGLHRARMQSEPDLSGLERRFEGLNERIDVLADKIASLRVGAPRDLRGQRSFDTAIAELKTLMERNQPQADDGRLLGAVQSLEQRLDAVVRAASQKEQTPAKDILEQQFAGLKSRLDEIAEKVADRRVVDHGSNQAMAQIGQAIEELKHAIRSGERSSDDARVIEAFQAIERRMESLERTPTELVARVDQLQAMLAGRTTSAAPVSPDVELLLQKLAAQIDRMPSGASDERAFDRLHEDIRAISDRLNMAPAVGSNPGLAEIGQLERSVSTLIGELEGLKTNIGSTAENAARLAATDVLKRVPQKAAEPLAENLIVQRQLSDMHVAQQEAEKRTSETLGAVHNALTQVVSRLIDMEKEMVKRQEAPLPAPQPVIPQVAPQQAQAFQPPMMPPQVAIRTPSPLQFQDAVADAIASPQRNSRANPLPELGADAPMPLPRPRPMADVPPSALVAEPLVAPTVTAPSSVAGMRAQKLGVQTPVATAPAAAASPIVGAIASAKGMLAGLRGGKNKAQPSANAEVAAGDLLTQPVAPPTAPSTASMLDMPLEPGSGRPRPGAAPRQAAPAVDPADPKANFLAAARRAAQVAADQSAEAMAQGSAPAKGAVAAGKAGLKKKHALLLGLAALIVAVGATLTFMKDAPPKKDAPAPISSVAPASREATARRTDAPQQPASAPRQILPQPQEITPPTRAEDRVASLPTRAAQPNGAFLPPDTNPVGSISSEAARPVAPSLSAPAASPPRLPAANDQLLQFQGINGSERLKEAARSGDTSAFIELGNRYLEGKGAPRDQKTAALWYERAADFGSAPAQYRLGALYREGKGVERNTKMALKHFQSAAEAGNARAMHNTAVLLAEGANGAPDYAGATDWFKKAAEFGIRDSQYNLAILYARGLGVSQDLMASYAWFAAAAASGDEDAGKKRDEVGARLPAERLQQAKAAAQSWRAKTPDPSANEVGMPAGGWDSSAKQVPNAAKPPTTQRRI